MGWRLLDKAPQRVAESGCIRQPAKQHREIALFCWWLDSARHAEAMELLTEPLWLVREKEYAPAWLHLSSGDGCRQRDVKPKVRLADASAAVEDHNSRGHADNGAIQSGKPYAEAPSILVRRSVALRHGL